MAHPLDLYRLHFARNTWRERLFDNPAATTQTWLLGLYAKYRNELVRLAEHLQHHYYAMIRSGFGAVFGDVEGELLYLLVREFQPELIYEISPNAGYSTNYLLAAVTRNGKGRVEGFELIPQFYGQPTEEVIRSHLIELCDPSRYHVNLGDARITSLERLAHETPDFVFLDSCHEDFFAEFYVKELLPRSRGLAFVQDIVHFDPRPEASREAYYFLSFLQETGSRFLAVGSYENRLNAAGVRDSLQPRRAIRSNSLVVRLPDQPVKSDPPDGKLALLARAEAGQVPRPAAPEAFRTLPLNASRVFPGFVQSLDPATLTAPEDQYVAVYYAGKQRSTPWGLCDLLAWKEGRIGFLDQHKPALMEQFGKCDPYGQVLILEGFVRGGALKEARRLLHRVQGRTIAGADLPTRLARIALELQDRPTALLWLERSHAAGDVSLAVGYRNWLTAAELYGQAGEWGQARDAFRAALEHVRQRGAAVVSKASREIFHFCLRHPRFFPLLWGARLQQRQWLPVAGQLCLLLLRSLARHWSLAWAWKLARRFWHNSLVACQRPLPAGKTLGLALPDKTKGLAESPNRLQYRKGA